MRLHRCWGWCLPKTLSIPDTGERDWGVCGGVGGAGGVMCTW